MLKKALCIYSIATLPFLGTFAYADDAEDSTFEPIEQQIEQLVAHNDYEEETLVEFDEDSEEESISCRCKDKDRKVLFFESENEESFLSCDCDDEGEEEVPPVITQEAESLC